MKNVGILAVTIAVLFFCGAVHAERTVWYVHPDSALNMIQAGLDSCADNDIVLVGPGTYVENIVWPNTQGIHLISELGPDLTIIDGDSIGRVITITTVVDTATMIRGFTIRNGCAPGYESGGGILCDSASPIIIGNTIVNNVTNAFFYGGGGIACCDSSQAIIINNVIMNNDAAFGGGGILYTRYSQGTIADNTIINNTAWWGGGIFCVDFSSPLIARNIIGSNICYYNASITNQSVFSNSEEKDVVLNRCCSSGGGICCFIGSSPHICSNVINGNGAENGGGICAPYYDSPFIIDNNTITGNTGLGSSGCGGGIYCAGDTVVVTIKHNDITNNTAPYLGGGICIDGYSRAAIDSCTISNNIGDGVGCIFPDYLTMHYNNISGNEGYGVRHTQAQVTIDAENNWWGHASGPFHPIMNPGGQGDPVSDSVDFDPWLTDSVQWVGVEEQPIVKTVGTRKNLDATIIRGPLRLPEGKKCKVYDITGRVVEPNGIQPGIYFIEVDGVVTQKVVKVR